MTPDQDAVFAPPLSLLQLFSQHPLSSKKVRLSVSKISEVASMLEHTHVHGSITKSKGTATRALKAEEERRASN